MIKQFRLNFRLFSLLAAAIALGTTACATDTATTPEAGSDEVAANSETAAEDFDIRISGAGASFPAPLYQRWFAEINNEYPGLQINYQSVGSGAGVEQFLAGTVDFGASDAPLTDEERQSFVDTYGAQPVQVPMTAGTVVFAYNLEGVDNLELPREAYCGIVTGDITNWSDPVITEANPDATLPDQPINFVHRSDGSGTTFLFTSHIEAACDNWAAGSGKSIEWPVGVGAKGNEGIAAQVQQTAGSVGYVEYAYASENDISMAAIENSSGNIVAPSPETAGLVFQDATIPEDFALTVPDPENPDAYPIAGLTWLLLYPEYENPETARALQTTIEWAFNEGDSIATELGYIPLPEQVETRVQDTVSQQYAGVGGDSTAEAAAN